MDAACLIIQGHWKRYQTTQAIRLKSALVEKLTCSICSDAYPTLHRCSHGHGMCFYCYDQVKDKSCAMCRGSVYDTVDATVGQVASMCQLKVPCGICNQMFPLNSVEEHRKWCPQYMFLCPTREQCMHHVYARNLIEHLRHHDRDVYFLDSSKTFSTCIGTAMQYFLIVVDDVVVVLRTIGLRAEFYENSNTGLPLICFYMKAYYTSSKPMWMNASINHHHPRRHDSVLETFNISRVPAITTLSERQGHAPVAIISPKATCKESPLLCTPQLSANVANIMSTFTRSMGIKEWTPNSAQARRLPTLQSLREVDEEVALVTITFSKTADPVQL
jgi:hypothetical protein